MINRKFKKILITGITGSVGSYLSEYILKIDKSLVVTTSQDLAIADTKKGINLMIKFGIPLTGLIENMSYFSPPELPENKYYIFGKRGAEYLANDKKVPFLGSIPIVQSVREASDYGHPASLQENSSIAKEFENVTKNLVSEVLLRNKNLPPTKVVEITNLVGCEAIKS